MPKFKLGWPPVRRETAEDVERDIALAEAGRTEYRRVLGPQRGMVHLYGSDEPTRSMRSKLQEDLEGAFTDEEKLKVVEHWVRKRMVGGRKRHVAEAEVLRMLQDLQEGVD